MEIINSLINSSGIPVLTAFLVGIMTSISPCPLATNVAAIAYISRQIKTPRRTLLNGLVYTLGRATSYTAISIALFAGLSSFQIARIFQGWGDKILGPILVIIGLTMLGVIKIPIPAGSSKLNNLKESLANKGFLGAFLLGGLFALAFCPYSGVLFFGMLVPLMLGSTEGILLAPIFALGTGLPVIIFSFLIAFGVKAMGQAFKAMEKVEKVMRYGVALVFLGVGLYYIYHLAIFLTSL